jgi:hypothetical protein
MYYNCTYNLIRVRLNNRLVRKILRAFEKEIKEKNLKRENSWLIIANYKLLKRMRKHPNYKRFVGHRDKFYKKINDRRLFIANDWKIFLSYNNWNTIPMSHKAYKEYNNWIDTIIKFLLKHPIDCPF